MSANCRSQFFPLLIVGSLLVSPSNGYSQYQDDPFKIVVDNKTGYIDRSGSIVIEPNFTSGLDFSEGRAAVVVDGKWMFIDESGSFISERKFDQVGHFREGHCRVAVGPFGKRRWGYIDRTGRLTVDFQYKKARDYSEGLAQVVHVDNSNGFIDFDGNLVTDAGTTDFSEGLTIFTMTGYVDRDQNQVIDLSKTAPEVRATGRGVFKEGLAYVHLVGGGMGFVERESGKLAFRIDADVVSVNSFSEGLARFTLNEKSGEDFKYGYVDREGNIVIQPRAYVYAYDFSEGKAAVAIREEGHRKKYGFIDTSGQFAIPLSFAHAENFDRGMARVLTDQGMAYIDHSGSFVWKSW